MLKLLSSLGAQHLNDGLVALKDKLLSHAGLYVLHSTGKKRCAIPKNSRFSTARLSSFLFGTLK